MNIDIRTSITNNFKDTNDLEIKKAIENSIKDNSELTLPGLGVFFEILWKNSDTNLHYQIIEKIKRGL